MGSPFHHGMDGAIDLPVPGVSYTECTGLASQMIVYPSRQWWHPPINCSKVTAD
jgi:hypothetical protein